MQSNKIHLNDFLNGRPIEDQRTILKAFYDDAYAADVYKPTTGETLWSKYIQAGGNAVGKLLDVGCGNGCGVKVGRESGWDVYGCDLANATRYWKENGVDDYCVMADARNMPYTDREFNFVSCNDVLEHIPIEDIPGTLREIYRVCNNVAFFGIALEEERAPVRGVIYTHITLKSPEWWKNEIEEAGFKDLKITDKSHHFGAWGFRKPFSPEKATKGEPCQ